jgi:hypothetical protein
MNDPAEDNSVFETRIDRSERSYGAITAGVIALVFLAFVFHAATG